MPSFKAIVGSLAVRRWHNCSPSISIGAIARRFLLKAHGSIKNDKPLTLDFASYRELLVKNPTYRAFVGRVLTQFNLLVVGFGMSDPDFDEFLRMISNQMGGPVRQHVLIIRGKEKPEHVVLRHRYGFHALSITDWGDIPKLLRDAASRPCDFARQAIMNCVSKDVAIRIAQHENLPHLSAPGRTIMLAEMHRKLTTAINDNDLHAASEIIYSLGKLGSDDEAKRRLFDLLTPHNHREISAHAALALDSMLRAEDTIRLESCLREHLAQPAPTDSAYPDPDNRIPIYLAFLIAKNRRRAAETQSKVRSQPMPFNVTITPSPVS